MKDIRSLLHLKKTLYSVYDVLLMTDIVQQQQDEAHIFHHSERLLIKSDVSITSLFRTFTFGQSPPCLVALQMTDGGFQAFFLANMPLKKPFMILNARLFRCIMSQLWWGFFSSLLHWCTSISNSTFTNGFSYLEALHSHHIDASVSSSLRFLGRCNMFLKMNTVIYCIRICCFVIVVNPQNTVLYVFCKAFMLLLPNFKATNKHSVLT